MYFAPFVSLVELKDVKKALKELEWIINVQSKLNELEHNEAWDMDERPSYCSIIRTRWVFRNEVNQDGKIVRNKARLVSHRYNQEEDIIKIKLLLMLLI